MKKIETNGQFQEKLFHNEKIRVYPTNLPLTEINFWRDNNRTLFTFDRLERNTTKKIEDLSIDEVTGFVAAQDIHRLDVLKNSIERNGVQVPLIIRDDGKLLDGNRRYFACHLLRKQYSDKGLDEPKILSNIPVLVIRKDDLTDMQELKILAEANFIPDLKVAWPLDAQARAVNSYCESAVKRGVDRDAAILEAAGVFGISRGRVVDFLDVLKFTERFIEAGTSDDEKIRRHIIVEERFVYFWEFVNKGTKGQGKISDDAKLKEVTDMFFSLISDGRESVIRNVKQIEPLIQANKYPVAWDILSKSGGQDLGLVVNMVNERKEVRRAEDKIRLFLSWLNATGSLSSLAKIALQELIVVATKKVGE